MEAKQANDSISQCLGELAMERIEKLYTLGEAADMLGDHVTESSLSTEIKRKNLSYRKVGSKRYVTESDLVEMQNRCLVPAKDQDSISESEKASVQTSGSSGTTARIQAQDAARATFKALKNSSRSTSRPNGRRPAGKANLHA